MTSMRTVQQQDWCRCSRSAHLLTARSRPRRCQDVRAAAQPPHRPAPPAAKAKASTARAVLSEAEQQPGSGLSSSQRNAVEDNNSSAGLFAPLAARLTTVTDRSSDASSSRASTSRIHDNSSESSSSSSSVGTKEHNDEALLAGKLACLCVALLWGSYAPALRMVYSMDGPPGPVAVMLFRGVLQAVVLLSADAIASSRQGQQPGLAAAGKAANSSSQSGSSSKVGLAEAGSSSMDRDATSSRSGKSWLARLQSDNIVILGGLELGLWNYLATAVQTVGLQLTTATKAGFLIASTSLITPLLSTLLGDRPGLSTWIGSFIALSGTILIAADSAAAEADTVVDSVWNMGGELAILCAAFFYSLATVRLSSYARVVPPVKLAAAKSVVLGSAAMCTAGAAIWVAEGDVESLWPGWQSSPMAWGVLVWSALGPGALAAFLHAKGQSIVPAADAQVIFSSTPLWSAAAAYVMLGGEPVSEKTWIGGAAIVIAGIVASRRWR